MEGDALPGAPLQLSAASLRAEADEVQRRILQAAAAFDVALAAAAAQREAANLQHASGAAQQLQLMHEISVLQVASPEQAFMLRCTQHCAGCTRPQLSGN